MTENQQSASSASPSPKALRATTYGLRRVGDLVGDVAVWIVGIGVVVLMVNDRVDFAPALHQVGAWEAILFILATWGGAQVIKPIAYDVADRIDPDLHDGDDLWDATKALKANVAAINQGANYDDVRLGLQASGMLPALYELMQLLRNEYASEGEMDEAAALSDTAALVRSAAESFGHKNLGE